MAEVLPEKEKLDLDNYRGDLREVLFAIKGWLQAHRQPSDLDEAGRLLDLDYRTSLFKFLRELPSKKPIFARVAEELEKKFSESDPWIAGVPRKTEPAAKEEDAEMARGSVTRAVEQVKSAPEPEYVHDNRTAETNEVYDNARGSNVAGSSEVATNEVYDNARCSSRGSESDARDAMASSASRPHRVPVVDNAVRYDNRAEEAEGTVVEPVRQRTSLPSWIDRLLMCCPFVRPHRKVIEQRPLMVADHTHETDEAFTNKTNDVFTNEVYDNSAAGNSGYICAQAAAELAKKAGQC